LHRTYVGKAAALFGIVEAITHDPFIADAEPKVIDIDINVGVVLLVE
jgi:hypothetical protein